MTDSLSRQDKPASVFVVNVLNRTDGIYVFADRADAEAFVRAVEGDPTNPLACPEIATITDTPLVPSGGASSLIDAERDPDEYADDRAWAAGRWDA